MDSDDPRADGGRNQGSGANVRETFQGFFSTGSDPEGLKDTHQCTLFITDTELVVGDQGEFELLGGILKELPDQVFKIARKFLADEGSTISYEQATRQGGTKRLDLDDITKIQVERGMPPLGKHMVEIEQGHRRELNVFVGTPESYGEGDETQAFVDALQDAAVHAGGSPIVEEEYDF